MSKRVVKPVISTMPAHFPNFTPCIYIYIGMMSCRKEDSWETKFPRSFGKPSQRNPTYTLPARIGKVHRTGAVKALFVRLEASFIHGKRSHHPSVSRRALPKCSWVEMGGWAVVHKEAGCYIEWPSNEGSR